MDGIEVSNFRMVAVVIGRNEGERLVSSLKSVQAAGLPVVYADSASSDGSAALARSLGVPVIEITDDKPLSAGRGRNEGLREALRRWPEAEFAMFLDGDCTLDPDYPAKAQAVFIEHPTCAIVTGQLAERFPERSIYNRLCSIEWRTPPGAMTDVNSLGGIMAIRVKHFKAAGGFHLDAIAGEEPDLGARLLLSGKSLTKIDAAMATHDAEMLTFRQWWTRAVRSGHALAYRFARHGSSDLRDGRHEILSNLFWGLVLPGVAIGLAWSTRGASLLLFLAYLHLYRRARSNYRLRGVSEADARLVGRFIIYNKFAHVVGMLKYLANRARGQYRIIEYK